MVQESSTSLNLYLIFFISNFYRSRMKLLFTSSVACSASRREYLSWRAENSRSPLLELHHVGQCFQYILDYIRTIMIRRIRRESCMDPCMDPWSCRISCFCPSSAFCFFIKDAPGFFTIGTTLISSSFWAIRKIHIAEQHVSSRANLSSVCYCNERQVYITYRGQKRGVEIPT